MYQLNSLDVQLRLWRSMFWSALSNYRVDAAKFSNYARWRGSEVTTPRSGIPDLHPFQPQHIQLRPGAIHFQEFPSCHPRRTLIGTLNMNFPGALFQLLFGAVVGANILTMSLMNFFEAPIKILSP